MPRLLLLLAAASLSAGCTMLTVKTNPEGARVLYSPDGIDYKPWPPSSWEFGVGGGRKAQTPMRTLGGFGDAVFITVEKEGYARPLPQLAQLYGFRHERLEFDLRMLPGKYAEEMRAKGFLFYNGAWVDPKEKDLVERDGVVMPRAEADRLDNIAAGRVEYNGAWIPREEYEARVAADMQAKGFVRWKDRWVAPAEADAEKAIDAEVAAIAATKSYPDLAAPKVLGTTAISDVQVQLFNSTGEKVRFLFSGSRSIAVELDPYKSIGARPSDRIILPAGRYEIVAAPSGTDATGRPAGEKPAQPMWASWPLATGVQYSFNYHGTGGDLEKSITEFEPPAVKLDIEKPEIEVPEVEIPKSNLPPLPPRGDRGPR